jgi:hypothetical protein
VLDVLVHNAGTLGDDTLDGPTGTFQDEHVELPW